MQQKLNQISLEFENFRFTIPIPFEYVNRFRSITAQKALDEIQPVAMFIVAGLAHQLAAEKEPPSGYQMFKSIYCAREAGIGIPFSALESKTGMSKFIADCIKRKQGADQKGSNDEKAGEDEFLRYTIVPSKSRPDDFFQRVRDLLSRVNFKKTKENF
jgi:hypothetical protein